MKDDYYTLLLCLAILIFGGLTGWALTNYHYKYQVENNQTLPLNQSEQFNYYTLGYNNGQFLCGNLMINDLIKYQEFRTFGIYNNQSIPIQCKVMQ